MEPPQRDKREAPQRDNKDNCSEIFRDLVPRIYLIIYIPPEAIIKKPLNKKFRGGLLHFLTTFFGADAEINFHKKPYFDALLVHYDVLRPETENRLKRRCSGAGSQVVP